MAEPNAAWAAFCNLLDVDGAKDDGNGAAARALTVALTNYMSLRFGIQDITCLVDVINDQDVVAAVDTSINAIVAADTAVKEAADVVSSAISVIAVKPKIID
jgi:hypothetical protein